MLITNLDNTTYREGTLFQPGIVVLCFGRV